MKSTKVHSVKRLSPRERSFLLDYVGGKTATDAYMTLHPEMKRETARVLGCRFLKRVISKVDWPRLLEEAGLGDARLLCELERKLKAMETKFYEGAAIADVEDNGTQMRALELLADFLGKRKAELTLHHDIVEILPAPKPSQEQPPEGDE